MLPDNSPRDRYETAVTQAAGYAYDRASAMVADRVGAERTEWVRASEKSAPIGVAIVRIRNGVSFRRSGISADVPYRSLSREATLDAFRKLFSLAPYND